VFGGSVWRANEVDKKMKWISVGVGGYCNELSVLKLSEQRE
jgi:hypothetical protein